MDGSYLGGSGRESIGGVFRYSEGKVLLQFGKEVWVDSALYAELLAFQEDMLVAIASCWASSNFFVFESDSKSVIAWSWILCRLHDIFIMSLGNVAMCLSPVLN